ncbi:MAG: ABC transporter permease [Thaumarchaeota archaeon]|nr:ABC transporter permease [Nitrososphaerota archaeon]
MSGIFAIIVKELGDHLSSKRFTILFLLVYLAGLAGAYFGVQALISDPANSTGFSFPFLSLMTSIDGASPPFISFISIFGPIIGLALGFDSINREIASGTMSRLASQPIHRDDIINGKFLAGLVTIALLIMSIVLIITGMGILGLGIVPSLEEASRILAFSAISIVYISLWLGIGILLSILVRRTATSALAGIALWIFFSFIILFIAGLVTNLLVPMKVPITDNDPEIVTANDALRRSLTRLSPNTLFDEATIVLMNPTVRTLGLVIVDRPELIIPNPIALDQSLTLIWPHVTGLIAALIITFTISYLKFMRQDMRPSWE